MAIRWGHTAPIHHKADLFRLPRSISNHNKASSHTRKSHPIGRNIKSSSRQGRHRLGLHHVSRRRQGGRYRHTLEIGIGLASAQFHQSRPKSTPTADLWPHIGHTHRNADPTTYRWVLNILQLEVAQRKRQGLRSPTPSHLMTSLSKKKWTSSITTISNMIRVLPISIEI